MEIFMAFKNKEEALKILGLSKDDKAIDKQQIESAARKLAVKLHPDKNKNDDPNQNPSGMSEADAAREFQKVQDAKNALNDPNYKYEQPEQAHPQNENNSPNNNEEANKKSAADKAAEQAEFLKKLKADLDKQAAENQSLKDLNAKFSVESIPRKKSQEDKQDADQTSNALIIHGMQPQENDDNVFKIKMKYKDGDEEKEAEATLDMASSPPRAHVNPNDLKSIEAAMHAIKAAGGKSVTVSQEFADKHPKAVEKIKAMSEELGLQYKGPTPASTNKNSAQDNKPQETKQITQGPGNDAATDKKDHQPVDLEARKKQLEEKLSQLHQKMTECQQKIQSKEQEFAESDYTKLDSNTREKHQSDISELLKEKHGYAPEYNNLQEQLASINEQLENTPKNDAETHNTTENTNADGTAQNNQAEQAVHDTNSENTIYEQKTANIIPPADGNKYDFMGNTPNQEQEYKHNEAPSMS